MQSTSNSISEDANKTFLELPSGGTGYRLAWAPQFSRSPDGNFQVFLPKEVRAINAYTPQDSSELKEASLMDLRKQLDVKFRLSESAEYRLLDRIVKSIENNVVDPTDPTLNMWSVNQAIGQSVKSFMEKLSEKDLVDGKHGSSVHSGNEMKIHGIKKHPTAKIVLTLMPESRCPSEHYWASYLCKTGPFIPSSLDITSCDKFQWKARYKISSLAGYGSGDPVSIDGQMSTGLLSELARSAAIVLQCQYDRYYREAGQAAVGDEIRSFKNWFDCVDEQQGDATTHGQATLALLEARLDELLLSAAIHQVHETKVQRLTQADVSNAQLIVCPPLERATGHYLELESVPGQLCPEN